MFSLNRPNIIYEENWKKWLLNSDASTIKFIDFIINDLIIDMRKTGILADYEVIKKHPNGLYFKDDAWYKFKQKYKPDYKKTSFLIFIFRVDNDSFVVIDNSIQIDHNIINKDDKKKIINFLNLKLGSNYKWSGKNSDSILLNI